MGRGGRVVRQVAVSVAVAAFVVACLRLGWWQWQRYHSPGGSLQNLGYTLQWPTFALFALFMVWRLRRLERQRAERPEGDPPAAAPPPRPPASTPPATPATRPRAGAATRPAGQQPDDTDDELAAYNRYLAELNARHEEQRRGR